MTSFLTPDDDMAIVGMGRRCGVNGMAGQEDEPRVTRPWAEIFEDAVLPSGHSM